MYSGDTKGDPDLRISHVAIDEITLATGERLHDQLGGAGSHAAAGMALVAGPGRVGILSGVGADLPDSAKDWFATAGVDTAGLYITDPHTPRTVVVYAADGERVETPLYGPEHFAAASPSQVPVPASYVRPAAIYLFAGLEDDLWQRAVDLADPSGRRPASLLWELDAAVCRRERLDGLAAQAAQVDVLSLNRAEARSLCDDRHLGRCLDTLHDKGFEVVALRLGAGGAIVSTPEGVWGALPETGAVVDPTGAGNAFGGVVMDVGIRGLGLPVKGGADHGGEKVGGGVDRGLTGILARRPDGQEGGRRRRRIACRRSYTSHCF